MDKFEKNHKGEEVGKKPKWKINIKYWLALEVTTLVIVVILVWGLFSLPAVFYLGRPADVKVSPYQCKVCLLKDDRRAWAAVSSHETIGFGARRA